MMNNIDIGDVVSHPLFEIGVVLDVYDDWGYVSSSNSTFQVKLAHLEKRTR